VYAVKGRSFYTISTLSLLYTPRIPLTYWCCILILVECCLSVKTVKSQNRYLFVTVFWPMISLRKIRFYFRENRSQFALLIFHILCAFQKLVINIFVVWKGILTSLFLPFCYLSHSTILYYKWLLHSSG
jgi:hypothetical protein